ncbi:hypothetical protein L484_003437 [Morus notabilis]|uniref:Uncharacterized protein n=1 Tax=Morus notabilis TaxID=981085 RepID=W9SAB9_9ROSA|nr:hypothetical protein L484_003437 [Morus notabilis]
MAAKFLGRSGKIRTVRATDKNPTVWFKNLGKIRVWVRVRVKDHFFFKFGHFGLTVKKNWAFFRHGVKFGQRSPKIQVIQAKIQVVRAASSICQKIQKKSGEQRGKASPRRRAVGGLPFSGYPSLCPKKIIFGW